MSGERSLDKLLPLIVLEATRVADAERGSLFLVDRERNELWTKVAQGAATEIRMPADRGIAGAVVSSGEVVNLADAYADPRFNGTFDLATGYRTRSLLSVPMRDTAGAVVGVLQALNKRAGQFNEEDEELLLALGAQAAGAVENALLHADIHRLFEGFVSASVAAIESRDPSTAGHSGRVAALTLELARTLPKVHNGPYARTQFTEPEMQEIRYASLLHDFGKVGVREHVLTKADKLFPHEQENLKLRFGLARKDRELQSYRRRLAALKLRGESARDAIDAEENQRLLDAYRELDDIWSFILTCNRPTVLPAGGFERLNDISNLTVEGADGQPFPLLSAPELEQLSIRKGSLSDSERREIESHVAHTFRFLSLIPWTSTLRRVPEIAYAHHERADGSGYPRKMGHAAIPLQSKLMAICDVYDALTAADRPYKKAIPHPRALDILHAEAKDGKLDADLLRIFIEAEVSLRALKP